MFKSRQEFEEALVKAFQADIERLEKGERTAQSKKKYSDTSAIKDNESGSKILNDEHGAYQSTVDAHHKAWKEHPHHKALLEKPLNYGTHELVTDQYHTSLGHFARTGKVKPISHKEYKEAVSWKPPKNMLHKD